jgi:hypothetical protein
MFSSRLLLLPLLCGANSHGHNIYIYIYVYIYIYIYTQCSSLWSFVVVVGIILRMSR